MSIRRKITSTQVKELRKHNASLIKDLRVLSMELYNFVALTNLLKELVDNGDLALTKNDEKTTETWTEIKNALVSIDELYKPSLPLEAEPEVTNEQSK